MLATIVVQTLRGADKAKRSKAHAELAELKTALDRYNLDNAHYPTAG